jgi:cytochrome c553
MLGWKLTLGALALALAAGAGLGSAQDVEAGRAKAAVCLACHGPNGNSVNPVIPVLAGQTARYIYLQLKDFKEGRRTEPQMAPFLANLSRQDMHDISAFYAAQKPLPPAFSPDPVKVERGRAKAQEVLCTMCHLGGFKGQNEIPRVAGQHPGYVVKQMKAFKEGQRTNDAGNMSSVSKTLSDQDIDDLAHFLVSLD